MVNISIKSIRKFLHQTIEHDNKMSELVTCNYVDRLHKIEHS
jgi:hypothetical protein